MADSRNSISVSNVHRRAITQAAPPSAPRARHFHENSSDCCVGCLPPRNAAIKTIRPSLPPRMLYPAERPYSRIVRGLT
jgi:hypothetical protein